MSETAISPVTNAMLSSSCSPVAVLSDEDVLGSDGTVILPAPTLEAALQDLARLSALICRTPSALIAFVGEMQSLHNVAFGPDASLLPTGSEGNLTAHVATHRAPLLVPDTLADPRFAQDPAVIGEPSLRFYAAVPLIAHTGNVFGVLAIMDRAPRDFSSSSSTSTVSIISTVEILQTLADQIVTRIALHHVTVALEQERSENSRLSAMLAQQDQERKTEQAQAVTAVQARESQLRLITDAAPLLISYVDTQQRFQFVNRTYARWFGHAQDEFTGKTVVEVLGERAHDSIRPYIETALAGQAVTYERHMVYRHGISRYVQTSLVPDKAENGDVKGFVAVVSDLTERRQLEARQRFLVEAGELLASSLEYQTTLQSMAELMVPHLADWCVIHLLNSAGTLEQVSVAHIDPARIEFAHEFSRRYPPNPNSAGGPYGVVRSGKSEWSQEITEPMIRAAAQDEEHYRLLMATGMQSYLCVPLLARGRSLGAITLIGAESGQRFGPEEVTLVEELARRAAGAVDNSLLYQAERAQSEQLSLAISEVHHRVKNSLQSVAALLEMQIPEEGDTVPLEAVHDGLSQIKTIALVHDLLARDRPIGSVNVAQVLTNLAKLLSNSMSIRKQPIPIRVQTQPLEMSTKSATALALAVNELLTNAAKHSDSGQSEDECIEVRFYHTPEHAHVVVVDCGPGFSPSFNPRRDANIGLQLVQTLVQHDLQGTIAFLNRTDREPREGKHSPRGAWIEITFPLSVVTE